MPLNPNQAKDYVDSYVRDTDEDKKKKFPLFLTRIELDNFRHIKGLSFDISHPIMVVSGSNRAGKTSILLAIACSHFNFDRQDVCNGIWKRATWSDLVRFTKHDKQDADWKYSLYFKEGDNAPKPYQGFRRHLTKKWGGAGKKEGQIGHPTPNKPDGGRHVCLIDLNRINPGRHLSLSVYNKAREADAAQIDQSARIKEYLSYILETEVGVDKLIAAADNVIYKFNTHNDTVYSSFNSASGEDVLVNMLAQILYMPKNALILIDELEVGLHPKIQRRLMDVLYIISKEERKQFIIVSHSYAVLDSVPKESRVFIERQGAQHIIKASLSTYEALTRMDSVAFSVASIYVEDEISKWIVVEAVKDLNSENPGISRVLTPVVVGDAEKTYNYFKNRQQTRAYEPISPYPACVLDGDMEAKYPGEPDLFFHWKNMPPEKMLLSVYLSNNHDEALHYHLENSNPHCLLGKMVESGKAIGRRDAFEKCFEEYKKDPAGAAHYDLLKAFLKSLLERQ